MTNRSPGRSAHGAHGRTTVQTYMRSRFGGCSGLVPGIASITAGLQQVQGSTRVGMTRGALEAALLLLSTFATASCRGGERWRGFVYPDAVDLTDSRTLGEFATLAECRGAAVRYLADLHAGPKSSRPGDYECGLRCAPPTADRDIWLCEETLR